MKIRHTVNCTYHVKDQVQDDIRQDYGQDSKFETKETLVLKVSGGTKQVLSLFRERDGYFQTKMLG